MTALNGREHAGPSARRVVFFLLAGFITGSVLLGCAAPGAPVARQPAVPLAIIDLSAKQSGNAIVLSFALPKETAQGRTLVHPPTIEVYRAFESSQAGANGTISPPQLIVTVPSQSVEQYREGDQVLFPNSLTSAELAAHVDTDALYLVRTRISKRDSDSSNLARIRILPAPQPIEDLRAQISESAVQLSWMVPTILPAGAVQPTSIRYRVYRSEIAASNRLPPLESLNPLVPPPESLLIGESTVPSYNDAKFEFGRSYAYTVRCVAGYESGSAESENSKVLEVTPRDTFAPATPANVVATVTAGQKPGEPYVDLSWAMNSETDLAGYNVYRSENAEGNPGSRRNAGPLPTPVFRDISVTPGKHFYRVTAVDRSGNESSPSAPILVIVPSEHDGTRPLR